MSYKTILVHLDGRARNEHTLRLASDLAGRFDAHLAAVYALEQQLFAAAMDPGATAALTFQVELDTQMQAKAQEMVKAAEQNSGRKIEWRAISGNTVNNVILHARHADLLVMTQEDRGEKMGFDPSFAASVVVGAGRPVLMVPYAGEFPLVRGVGPDRMEWHARIGARDCGCAATDEEGTRDQYRLIQSQG